MILKIAKAKVQFVVPMLNGEKVIVKIENISTKERVELIKEVETTITVMVVKTAMYGENDYINGNKQRGNILGVSNTFEFDLAENKKPYPTIAIQKIKQALKDTLQLADVDIEILSNLIWEEDKTDYPIRITLPTDEIVGKYQALIVSQDKNPRHKALYGYTLYVPLILPEHDFIKDDQNVLIEYV